MNPDLAGGSDLSVAPGIAAATNVETFSIGAHAPQIDMASYTSNKVYLIK